MISSPDLRLKASIEETLHAEAGTGLAQRSWDWKAILIAALYLSVCLLVQWRAHASAAAFGSYPDEPAHYVGGLLVRDYLVSGFHQSPLAFAQWYYERLPYFAVGYWPPLFYCIEGLWILLFGPAKPALLWLMAAFAGGSAWLIFHAIRREAGVVAGFCGGLLFLAIPEVQRQLCAVMVDLPVTFLTLGATVFATRYLSSGAWKDSIGFAVLAAAACLTKYSAAYICLVPFLGILVLRRWRWLRFATFWMQAAIIFALVAPWAIWTAHLASTGLPATHISVLFRFAKVLRAFWRVPPWPVWLVIGAGIGSWIWRPVRWRETGVVFAFHAVALVGLLSFASVAPESRYFTPAAAAMLVAGLSGFHWLTPPFGRNLLTAALFAAVLLTVSLTVRNGTHLRANNFEGGVEHVLAQPSWRGATILIAGDVEGPMIAEFAMRDPQRPGYRLIRPGKILAKDDWFGGGYRSLFQSPDEVESALIQLHVQAVILRATPDLPARPHDVLLRETITTRPKLWRRVFGGGSAPSSYDVFETGSQLSLH